MAVGLARHVIRSVVALLAVLTLGCSTSSTEPDASESLDTTERSEPDESKSPDQRELLACYVEGLSQSRYVGENGGTGKCRHLHCLPKSHMPSSIISAVGRELRAGHSKLRLQLGLEWRTLIVDSTRSMI